MEQEPLCLYHALFRLSGRHNMELAENEISHLSFGGALQIYYFLSVSLNIIPF